MIANIGDYPEGAVMVEDGYAMAFELHGEGNALPKFGLAAQSMPGCHGLPV
jgi:hypothetical protein